MKREITFKCDKNAQKRAYYFRRLSFRWFPMAVAEAELLISTGAAIFVPLHKTILTPGQKGA